MADPLPSLFNRRTLFTAIALTIVFIGLLYVEGRPWSCKQGLGFWAAAWTRCTSQHFLDPYAFTHVLHGIIFYWLLWPFAPKFALPWRMMGALALEIGWELLENSPWVIARYRQDTAALDYTGDSIINAVGDVLATVIGFAVASQFSWKVSLAVFIALELALLYLIRDNLTLNVFMLLCPLEPLQEWQLIQIRD
jgi:hypothetical protein